MIRRGPQDSPPPASTDVSNPAGGTACSRGSTASPEHRTSADRSLLAACLSAGGLATISHRSAAEHWGFHLPDPHPLEISVDRERASAITGVDVHRSRDLSVDHIVEDGPLPFTTPVRTLVDLGQVVPWYLVRGLLEHLVTKRLVTVDQARAGADPALPQGAARVRCAPPRPPATGVARSPGRQRPRSCVRRPVRRPGPTGAPVSVRHHGRWGRAPHRLRVPRSTAGHRSGRIRDARHRSRLRVRSDPGQRPDAVGLDRAPLHLGPGHPSAQRRWPRSSDAPGVCESRNRDTPRTGHENCR